VEQSVAGSSDVFFLGKNSPVYLSIDIDTIDPAFAPATGTPETGGWSTREIRTIIRGLEGINLAAADIVEVAPAYDTNAELTTMVSRQYYGCSIGPHANLVLSQSGRRRRPLRGDDSHGQVWTDDAVRPERGQRGSLSFMPRVLRGSKELELGADWNTWIVVLAKNLWDGSAGH
jgi:hypothetical protein